MLQNMIKSSSRKKMAVLTNQGIFSVAFLFSCGYLSLICVFLCPMVIEYGYYSRNGDRKDGYSIKRPYRHRTCKFTHWYCLLLLWNYNLTGKKCCVFYYKLKWNADFPALYAILFRRILSSFYPIPINSLQLAICYIFISAVHTHHVKISYHYLHSKAITTD